MPLDIGGGPTTLTPRPRRRRPADEAAEYSADFDQKLAAGQAASKNSLSSDLVYGLALAGDHDKEVARATAILARNGDLLFPRTNQLVIPDPNDPSRTVTITPRDFVDPLTHNKVDLRRARSWFQDAGIASSIAPVLAQLQNKGYTYAGLAGRRDPETGRTFTARERLNPYSVAAYVDALSVLPGKMPVASALNAAAHLAHLNVDRGRFVQALGVMVEWNGQTGLLDEGELVGMAQYWAQNSDRALRLQDVGPMYDPEVGQALETSKEFLTSMTRPSRYPVTESGRAAIEDIRQIQGAADKAARSAADYERYDAMIHDALDGVLSTEASFAQRAVVGTFDWLNRQVLGRIGGAAWYAASFASFGIEAEEQAEMRDEGIDLFLHGSDPENRETFGDYYAQSVGADPGSVGYNIVAVGSEFALYWFTDPFVVAGKLSRGWQLGRMVLTGTERELETAGAISQFAYGLRTRGKDIATRVEEELAAGVPSRYVAVVPAGAKIQLPSTMPVNLLDEGIDPIWNAQAAARAAAPSEAAGITSRLSTAEEAAAQDAFAAKLLGEAAPPPTPVVEVAIDEASGRYFVVSGTEHIAAAREAGLPEVPVKFLTDATDEAGAHLASNTTLPVLNIRAPRMTFGEWLYRASMQNPEAAARAPRGAMGSPGIDGRVTAWIREWGRLRYNGKVTFEAIEDTKDIWRVAIGARPATEAGYRFREAIEAGGLKIVESRINGLARKVIGTRLSEVETITPMVRKQILVEMNRGLLDIGLNKTTIASVLDNLRKATDDELALLATTSRKQLRQALGLERALGRSDILDQDFLRASDLMRAHVRDLVERRESVESFIGGVGRSYKGQVRKLRQLVNKQEWNDLVRPMLDEEAPLEDIITALVQHQRGGGLIGDLISKAGLSEAKGNVTAIMEEVRGVLGDDLADLIMAGVSTQGQLRTRLRQLIAGPGSLAYGDLESGALQLGIHTWQDQLGLIEGVQRVYPDLGGGIASWRAARQSIKDSPFWHSRANAWYRSIYEKNPPSVLNIEGFNAAEGFGRWLRGMNVPQSQIDDALSEMQRLVATRGGLRQKQIATFMKTWIERAYKAKGIPEEQVAVIMRKVRPHYDYVSKLINNKGKIAAEAGMDQMAEPPLETLLKNIWLLPSPNEMDIAVRRAFGRFHGVQYQAARRFGKNVADLTDGEWKALTNDIGKTRQLMGRGLEGASIWADHARNTWVAWQLLRPGWALKVLPDENFRSLVMLHDLFDRISAIRFYARALDRFGVSGRQMVVKMVDGTEHTFSLRLPGLNPHEPAAAQGLMHGTMLRSDAWRQAQLAKAVHAAVVPLEAGSKQYMQVWAHLLDRRVLGSDLGTWIMKSLVHDTSDGRPWTYGRVLENARAEPRVWQGLRQPGEELEDVVARAKTYVIQSVSTQGRINTDLVQHALDGQVTPNSLKRLARGLDTTDLPTLPQLEIEEAVGVRTALLAGKREMLTNALMRWPSDSLNRNPLFKALYNRELERLIKVETAAGRRFTRNELAAISNGEHPLAMNARAYALDRELGTMFTYINNSRFSEATRHLFPFFSPYQEQFSVWGRLLWQNPHIAEQTRLMLKLAVDTGVVYRDEGTGELVVNSKVLSVGLATVLMFHPASLIPIAAALGAGAVGSLRGLPDSTWATPVANMNLFLSNTLTVGGIPIPTPGLSPPFEFLANQAAENTGDFPFKSNLVNYFSAYGSDLSILPASWHKALTAVFPRFDPGLYENTKNHMVDALILQGFELTDEKGHQIPGAAEELDKIASGMTRDWLLLRAVNQFVQPTAPMMTTEADEVRDEFFDLIDQMGYRKAIRTMQERYPDAPNIGMLAIGYSLWNQPGPSLPPTLEASAILNEPRFRQAAKEYPELAFFLIPNEFRDGTYSFDDARAQLDEALRTTNPAVVLESEGIVGGRAGEYLRNQGWDQFFAIESTFKAKLKAAGVGPDQASSYAAIKARWYDKPIDQLQMQNLTWARDFQLHEEPFLDEALNKLRTVSTLPIWRDTEMGKALRDYFAVADPIRRAMHNNNITALDTASAEELGLDEQYKALVADMENRYPNTWPYLEHFWLGDDFKNVATHREDVLRKLGANENWVADVLGPWERRWDEAGNRITNANTQTEESAAFIELNRLSLQAQRLEGPGGLNPQDVWWQTQTRHEKADTRLRVAQKPYVFLTTFERQEILGIKTTPLVEKTFISIAEAKVEVNRAIDRGMDTSTAWDRFDKWVKDEVYPVPGMRKAIKQAHGFGFTLFRNIPKEWMGGVEGDAWRAIREGANDIHQAFIDKEFVDDETFRRVRVAFGAYIDEWKEYSPDFKDHVNELRDLSGDQLVEVLLPELWWTLI